MPSNFLTFHQHRPRDHRYIVRLTSHFDRESFRIAVASILAVCVLAGVLPASSNADRLETTTDVDRAGLAVEQLRVTEPNSDRARTHATYGRVNPSRELTRGKAAARALFATHSGDLMSMKKTLATLLQQAKAGLPTRVIVGDLAVDARSDAQTGTPAAGRPESTPISITATREELFGSIPKVFSITPPAEMLYQHAAKRLQTMAGRCHGPAGYACARSVLHARRFDDSRRQPFCNFQWRKHNERLNREHADSFNRPELCD